MKDYGLEARRLNTGVFIEKFSYISFDVFDTLIKRSVAKPTDLFLLMENHLAAARPEIPSGFAQKRQDAERRAKEKEGVSTKLQDIYRELRGEYGEYTEELMALETEMELRGCRPNPKCVRWYDRCISEGKTVVLISDMYLPAQIIGEMLKKCGVHGYQKLYVSCECRTRKRDGSLFKAVLKELNIRPRQLVHIGDNRRGDLLAPASLGICAIWVRNDHKKLCKIPKDIRPESELAYRTLRACIRNCSQAMGAYERMGCELFGPQLYGFTSWLAEQLKQDGIRDAYFLSRDGYMLQRAFDEMGIEGIKTHYLYCSRRAYQLPLLKNSEKLADTNFLTWHRKNMTVHRFFLQLGLDPSAYAETAKAHGVELDHVYPIKEFVDSEEIAQLYLAVQGEVVRNAWAEYNALVKYLQAMQLPEKLAIIDIGFYGTVQKCLDAITEECSQEVKTFGYYFKLSNKTQEVYHITATGYHYGNKANELLFEAQFLKQQGSLKRFRIGENGESFPEFEEFEYQDDASKLFDETEFFDRYQAGAIAFIRYMKEAVPADSLSVDYPLAIRAFERLCTAPTLKEAALWGKIRYINFTTGYMANPKRFFYYAAHPGKLHSDLRASGWRIGFMKRLIKLPLPYDKILDFMKKLYNKA